MTADDGAGGGRVSRRRFIGTAVAVTAVATAAVAVGVPALQRLGDRRAGKLVPELLKTPSFTVAHRGGSADWPEMSRFAYDNAVAHGVNALEISLARSSDGVWFGLHDSTLDRTSGTPRFLAAEHTWAEISRLTITAAGTSDPSQKRRPYLRFEELVAAYADRYTIFVDPKVVPPRYFAELFRLMAAAPGRATDAFIAKGYCTSATWAAAAREEGYRGWGYYYGAEVGKDADLLPSTQADWTLLGMDVAASESDWTAARAFRKPVLGHIIATRSQEDTVHGHGAAGSVVSGVVEVLG